jgi:hypothetical protein
MRPLEPRELDIATTSKQSMSEMSHSHRDFFFLLFPHPYLEGSKPPQTRSATTM